MIAEDQEQVDKMLELRAQIPRVERVIYWDPKGMRQYADPWLLPFRSVQECGSGVHAHESRTDSSGWSRPATIWP